MITVSATGILILALILAFVLVAGVWAYSTANRLDRLHVRGDRALQALEAALARRAVVARTVAASLLACDDPAVAKQAHGVVALADRTEQVDWTERETAENRLAATLSAIDVTTLPPQLVAELADAEARVLIARRFHNDAVRDTLALRTRRLVRLLHLGGTAPLPTYFEIAERVTAGVGSAVDPPRTSARVVLLDDQDRVLLVRGHDPKTGQPAFWFTLGGGVEPGEALPTTAVREVWEETGYALDSSALRGPLWRRRAVFPFGGKLVHSEELFFAARVPAFEPNREGSTDTERSYVTGMKWCNAADIMALDASGETVYPQRLDLLLPEAAAATLTEDSILVANTPPRAIR